MAQKKSSIEFTEPSKALLKTLKIRDSQKNIVSVGIMVFGKLSAEQREIAIAEANGVEGKTLNLRVTSTAETKKLWSELQKIAKKVGVKIEVPENG